MFDVRYEATRSPLSFASAALVTHVLKRPTTATFSHIALTEMRWPPLDKDLVAFFITDFTQPLLYFPFMDRNTPRQNGHGHGHGDLVSFNHQPAVEFVGVLRAFCICMIKRGTGTEKKKRFPSFNSLYLLLLLSFKLSVYA